MEHGGGYDSWRKTSIVATPFDFDKAESIRPKGHCVAVRVTSEDPDDGFKPTSGKVQVSINIFSVIINTCWLSHFLLSLCCMTTFPLEKKGTIVNLC